MIYSIAYEIRNIERTSRFVRRINEFGDNIQYLSNSFFLQSDNTITQLYNDFRSITDAEDRILIIQVKNKNALMGWLNSTVVNWIKEHN